MAARMVSKSLPVVVVLLSIVTYLWTTTTTAFVPTQQQERRTLCRRRRTAASAVTSPPPFFTTTLLLHPQHGQPLLSNRKNLYSSNNNHNHKNGDARRCFSSSSSSSLSSKTQWSIMMAKTEEDDDGDDDGVEDDQPNIGEDQMEEDNDEDGVVVVESVITNDNAVVAVNVPKWKRILLFYKYKQNKDNDDGLTFRQRLAKAGLSVVLSYGFVSNMSYCVSVSVAWYLFCRQTQLSPLAPGQWKPFLAVYSGFWVFNNLVRPIRLGVSVALSTQFDKLVAWIERKARVRRGVAIGLVVFLANVVGTTVIMCSGIALAAALAGVPIRPS